MRSVRLQIDDSIYNNIMFLLNNLKINGLQIIEQKNENITVSTQKELLQELFKHKQVKAFENIENPVLWQQEQRDEW